MNIEYNEEFEIDDNDSDYEKVEKMTNFSQAVIWGTDWTTETIVNQLTKNNIDLNPSFQRRDAWTDKEKSRLIESLMLGLPVPPIILAEVANHKYIVIDGKQRLLSIRRFYSDKKIINEEKEFKQLRLTGLDILTDLNGQTYQNLEFNGSEYIRNLENQPIRTIVIRNWPDENFLYTVFLRLNTGSKKLSPQELRQALKPGPFLTYLDKATATSEPIKKMLNNKGADSRMKDVELALRYFAYKHYFEYYNGNLKEFLDIACEELNKEWEYNESQIVIQFTELEAAIQCAFTIFGEKSPFGRLNSIGDSGRFHRSIFEILSYYFSDETLRTLVLNDVESFKEAMIELNQNQNFISAITDTTKDINKVVTRFTLFENMLIRLYGTTSITQTISLLDGKIKRQIKEGE